MTSSPIQDKEPLSKILAFAAQAHSGQQRKFTDEPYINHPQRVMEECAAINQAQPVLAAALLHDVIEDTLITPDQLRDFLVECVGKNEANRIMALVLDLTDTHTKKQYPNWNRRKRKQKEAERLSGINPDAQTIKYADIIDNSLTLHGSDFAPVYLREVKTILQSMNKGHAALYTKAVETVNDCLSKIGQ